MEELSQHVSIRALSGSHEYMLQPRSLAQGVDCSTSQMVQTFHKRSVRNNFIPEDRSRIRVM